MRWSWRAVVVKGGLLVAVAASALVGAAHAEDVGRGRALYEARCDGCHDKSVHNRASRKARDFNSLQREVARWNAELGRAWTSEEIDDVTAYLNQQYYRFPCPTSICKTQYRAGVDARGD